jgi:thiol-disulfide isomerase/thioredoxin
MILLWPFWSRGQKVKPLTIGDIVPDITITNVYNYPASTIHLSDLKGKLVILDFWSTWCGSCIEAIPEMENLQKEFGDKIQIILVNVFPHDDPNKVKSFFQKRKGRTGLEVDLPYSLLQLSLRGYFPFKFIPHYVWINKKGKIIATTSRNEMTSINVSNALRGIVSGIHNKIDLLDFSGDIPLLVNGNGGNDSDFIYRSLFTKYIEGAGSTENVFKDNNGKIIRYYMLNNPPIMLLETAYPFKLNCSHNRIINESNNKSIFLPAKPSDVYKNSFCYEIIIPPSPSNEFQHYMQEDLKRYLGVKVTSELRKMNCLVLYKRDSINEIATKGGEANMDINESSIRKFISNEPVSTLIDLLNHLPVSKTLPVIDETGISGNIDLELPTDLFDLSLDSLKSFLKRKGLELLEKEREIKVAVIKDK